MTSEAGHKLAPMPSAPFRAGHADGVVVSVRPEERKQVIFGIGTSFTESSAFVLAHLESEARRAVMKELFAQEGANFSLARTHIGSCDFSVEGRYSYAERVGDEELESFSIAPDTAGFDRSEYPRVRDPAYDLLPMIHEALSIKKGQTDGDLRIVASAWSAPPWMKDIEMWWVPAGPDNHWRGTGGELKPHYVDTYAAYLVKYLDAYRAAGVDIWALTPVNEPHGNNGSWESMHFTPESQRRFIAENLGPRLQSSDHPGTKLLIYDQNRDGLEEWTDTIFADPQARDYVFGAAIHWYASTVNAFEDVLGRVHAKFPEFAIIHTEGTIDNLGNDAPAGVDDPEGFKESDWFGNDSFWWNANATDWAYGAPWAGASSEEHPIYVPVHRYARNIIVSLDNWVGGWIDWNAVLDRNGGPNHVGNNCGAPIMIDTETLEVYYTPIYYILAQFSRTIRPGDRAVATERSLGGLDGDALHASATINDEGIVTVQLLNTTKAPIAYELQLADEYAELTIPANSLQSVRIVY